MLVGLQPDLGATAADLDRLTLSSQPFLERNVQASIDCLDDLINEQQKVRWGGGWGDGTGRRAAAVGGGGAGGVAGELSARGDGWRALERGDG